MKLTKRGSHSRRANIGIEAGISHWVGKKMLTTQKQCVFHPFYTPDLRSPQPGRAPRRPTRPGHKGMPIGGAKSSHGIAESSHGIAESPHGIAESPHGNKSPIEK